MAVVRDDFPEEMMPETKFEAFAEWEGIEFSKVWQLG